MSIMDIDRGVAPRRQTWATGLSVAREMDGDSAMIARPAGGCRHDSGRHDVRVIDRGSEPWFVLADVCRVLEIANPRNVAARLDDDEKGVHQVDTLGGPQNVTIISEPGLYAVVQRSDKPAARRFDRWVRHEVLPAIRKTGRYDATAAPAANEPDDVLMARAQSGVPSISPTVPRQLGGSGPGRRPRRFDRTPRGRSSVSRGVDPTDTLGCRRAGRNARGGPPARKPRARNRRSEARNDVARKRAKIAVAPPCRPWVSSEGPAASPSYPP